MKLYRLYGFATQRGFKTKRVTRVVNNPESSSVEAVVTPMFAHLRRPFLFTISVVGCSFCGAMIWQYESMRYRFYKNQRLHSSKNDKVPKVSNVREFINSWWNSFTPPKKMIMTILAANLGIFLLWRIPRYVPTLTQYFTSSPVSSAPCLSMLLSTFSHRDVFHLAANMYVLWSFSNVATNLFGREQFLAMYLSAGVISSFSSYIVKVIRVSPVPSLGASGAIMAILGAVCVNYPDARLSFVLLGDIFNFTFSADTALKSIMVFDTVGLLMGWRLFDHAAHLGGLLFGIWYVKYGRRVIWNRRDYVMKKWHKIRGKQR